MARFGVTEAANPPQHKNLFGSGERVFERGTIEAGVKYVRGEVLARTGAIGSRIYEKLNRETVVSTAESIANISASAHVFRPLANANILPSSLAIESGSNAAWTVDQDTGEITFPTGTTAGTRGRVDFKRGIIFVTTPSGGALSGISATYSYMADDEQAAVICIGDLDLSDETSDSPITVLAIGPVIAGDLTWPADMTDAEIIRAREVLRQSGIIVQDY